MVRLALRSIADTAGFNFEEIEDIKTSVQEACKAISLPMARTCVAGEYTLECIVEARRSSRSPSPIPAKKRI